MRVSIAEAWTTRSTRPRHSSSWSSTVSTRPASSWTPAPASVARLGGAWRPASFLMAYTVQRYLSGEWDDAVDDVDNSDELAGVTGEGYHLIITRGVQALMQFHRNDVEAAAETRDAPWTS